MQMHMPLVKCEEAFNLFVVEGAWKVERGCEMRFRCAHNRCPSPPLNSNHQPLPLYPTPGLTSCSQSPTLCLIPCLLPPVSHPASCPLHQVLESSSSRPLAAQPILDLRGPQARLITNLEHLNMPVSVAGLFLPLSLSLELRGQTGQNMCKLKQLGR